MRSIVKFRLARISENGSIYGCLTVVTFFPTIIAAATISARVGVCRTKVEI